MNAQEGGDRKQVAEFVHKIAHDLQEPLSKVITISELLSEKLDNLDGTDKDYLLRMHEAARRMKKLIEDLTRQWTV